jgi:hypothetical protein
MPNEALQPTTVSFACGPLRASAAELDVSIWLS